VYSLLVMPQDPNWIWAGTEIGLVESLDGGQSWTLADYNIPATAIWDMKWMDDQVILATHGRGLWTVEIPELPELAFDPILGSVYQSVVPNSILLSVNFRSAYDSSYVFVNGIRTQLIASNEIEQTVLSVNTSEEQGAEVLIKSYKYGREYESYPKPIGGVLSSSNYIQNVDLLKVYPNPSNGKFVIELESPYSQALSISVYTYLGKLIKKVNLSLEATSNKVQLELNDVPNGLYILQAEGELIKQQARIIIER